MASSTLSNSFINNYLITGRVPNRGYSKNKSTEKILRVKFAVQYKNN